jgi:IMP dehydrogenase
MKYLNGLTPTFELTYSDVFLTPGRSDVASRMDVDLETPDGLGTSIPVVVANMTAISGRRMAETVARRGGLAVLPQDTPAGAIADMASFVKSCHTVLETPITLRPTDTINGAMDLINKRSHGTVVVVDEQQRPVGVFAESDGVGFDRFTPLHEVMRTGPITVSLGATAEEMFDELERRRVHLAPVVDDTGRLCGAITEKGALRATMYKPAVDSGGRLLVAAAVGVNGDVTRAAAELVEAGVDVIVVDTAHGHQKKMIEALSAVRSVAPDHPVVAGNVVTAEGTEDLISAGADIVKVGVGPGAMCTTRMMTGVGRPQFSAVLECAVSARRLGKHIWADGGVRYPRDVALALAAGAASVMIGSWLAGTHESAADAIRDSGGLLYKENYGMASKRAVTSRTRSESGLHRARKQLFEEGIAASRMYLSPSAPGVEDIIDQIVMGVRSAFTYAGARTVDEFHDRAVVGIQSSSGYSEGKPLNKSW